MDIPTTITFDWPAIVECAKQVPSPAPAAVPQAGQTTDDFIKNYGEAQAWGIRYQSILQCQFSLEAWKAGWEAGHAGKPKDPAIK